MISRLIPKPLRRLLGVKPPAPAASPTPPYLMLDQPGSLGPLLAALGRVDEVSLDTEADNMYSYRTRICLLQLLVGGEVFLVDVLAPGLALQPLWAALADKHLLMHGSDFDLRLMQAHGFRPRSIFDTMLASQLLGRERFGLSALLEEHFGVALRSEEHTSELQSH